MEIIDLGRKGLITTYWGDRKERTYIACREIYIIREN